VADEAIEPLSLGVVIGGDTPSNRPWREALDRLVPEVIEARAGLITPLNLNVVFHVPGNLVKPDYTGERTGRFSKKEMLLMVQVALPEEPPTDVDADLRRRLVAAVDEAQRWAIKRGIADSLTSLRDFASSL
jgi:hypothetical protein